VGDVKKVTVNLPAKALERAQRITGEGITSTLIAGLREILQREKRTALRRLRGKVHFELDVNRSRR
jgi:hypothetical protein